MENRKKQKSAMITVELMISLILVIVVLFVTLGLFSDSINTMIANGGFKNLFGGGNRTFFSQFGKDYSKSQFGVAVLSQLGLETMRQTANNNALEIIAKIKDGSATDADKTALALALAVINAITGSTDVCAKMSAPSVAACSSVAYTVKQGSTGTSLTITDPNGRSTIVNDLAKASDIFNYSNITDKTTAIKEISTKYEVAGTYALTQVIDQFTTNIVASGGGDTESDFNNSTSVSESERAIVDLIKTRLRDLFDKAYDSCDTPNAGPDAYNNSAFCNDVQTYTKEEYHQIIDNYVATLETKAIATNEVALLSTFSNPNYDSAIAEYWENWIKPVSISVQTADAVNTTDEPKIALNTTYTPVELNSEEPVVAGASTALLIETSNLSDEAKENSENLLAFSQLINFSSPITVRPKTGNEYGMPDYTGSFSDSWFTNIRNNVCNGENASSGRVWNSLTAYTCYPNTVNPLSDSKLENIVQSIQADYMTQNRRQIARRQALNSYYAFAEYSYELLKADGMMKLLSKDKGTYEMYKHSGGSYLGQTRAPICVSIKYNYMDYAKKYGLIDLIYILQNDPNGCG